MASEQWHADILITGEIAKKCIENQFPVLMPITAIRCIGEGWDNKVFLVDEHIIFRFPRRKIAVETITRENTVLKNIQILNLDVEVPNPKYIGYPTSLYPYPFHGYEMLQGVSGCHAQLSMQDRISSLARLAHFLKRLHSVDKSQAIAMGAEAQLFDRTNTSKAVNALNERVEKITVRKIVNIDKDQFQHEMKQIQKINLPADDKCLVHGDLYCRHLMFNNGQLTGIIDWGDTGINNESIDLSVIWSFYPASCHQQFFEIYGAVDPVTWQYARFFAIYSAFTIMLYGYDIDDTLLVQEAIDTIKRINPALLAIT